MFASLSLVWIAVVLVIAIYPLLALGRIWMYSREQVELLKDVRDLLQQQLALGSRAK